MKQNLCILNTRPDPEGRELSQTLQAHGHIGIQFPTIEIAPPHDIHAYEEELKHLGEKDWLIFISPQSVYASIPDIRKYWPNFPPDVKFAAVGESTAKALEKAGYLITIYPQSNWGSEGLLALPEFLNVNAQKIVVIRGEGGRELIEEKLIERGAEVSSLICYRRIAPKVDVLPYLLLLRENQIDVVICTAGEAIINLKKLTGDDDFPLLQNIPLIVVSERLKMLAQDLGFQTIWVAPNAKHESLIKTLENMRDE